MVNGRTIPTKKFPDTITKTIKIDGNVIDKKYQIDTISVTNELNRIPIAKLSLIDGDATAETFEVSNAELFIPGKEIEILVGYHSDEDRIFKGIIVKHSLRIKGNGNSVLILDCKDAAVKMTLGRNSRYFYEKKDSEVMEELIKNYKLTPEVEATAIPHKELIQYDSTDWDFILARAEMNGKICKVSNGTISIQAPIADQEPALTLIYGATVRELDAEIDARHQVGKVTSYSWDYSKQEPVEIVGQNPNIELHGNLSTTQLQEVASPKNWALRHGGSLSSSELQSWADAKILRQQLAKACGRVKFQGYANVEPGMTIELQGLGDRFNGLAYVSGIRHFVSEGDWWTDAQFGFNPEWFTYKYDISPPRASGLLSAVSGLQIGIVSSLEDDPEGEDRIQIRMPIINNADEGIWARVSCLYAGENRGSFFRPEIGDEVIVGFLNDDPRQPLVLGILNSSAKPAPFTASNDNPEKGMVTRSQMKIVFNDELPSLTMETPQGKKLILNDDEGNILIQDDHGNKIEMNSDGITIESAKDIVLKASGDVKTEATNINSSAKAQLKAEGSAGAELSSGGTTVIKGGIVQIN